MSYELVCEGFSPDEELEEDLLMQCRRLVIALNERAVIQFLVRHGEGRVLCRIEMFLSNRRLSSAVWRLDPVEAVGAAVDAMLESVQQGDRVIFAMNREPRTSTPQFSLYP